MEQAPSSQPVVMTRDQLTLLRRLSRLSASNVVRADAPEGVRIDRAVMHVTKDSDPRNLPYLKRRRTQPVGSVPCVDCGKTVSANKGRCFACEQTLLSREKESAELVQSAAVAEHSQSEATAA